MAESLEQRAEQLAQIEARWSETHGFTLGPDKRKLPGLLKPYTFECHCSDCGNWESDGHEEGCSWLIVETLLSALTDAKAEGRREQEKANGSPGSAVPNGL